MNLRTKGLEDDDELAFVDPRSKTAVRLAGRQVEHAIQFLLSTPSLPAILIAREWGTLGAEHAFEEMRAYRDIANSAGLHVLVTMQPNAGGVEHLAFVAREPYLSEAQLSDCIAVRWPRNSTPSHK